MESFSQYELASKFIILIFRYEKLLSVFECSRDIQLLTIELSIVLENQYKNEPKWNQQQYKQMLGLFQQFNKFISNHSNDHKR